MTPEQLSSLQSPLKERYKADPPAAVAHLTATGEVDFQAIRCRIDKPDVTPWEEGAGLHPPAGGTQPNVCSGDLLLEALVCCAGVTLAAVSTAMGLAIQSAKVTASGDLDFCGTLGVDRTTPVGLRQICLDFQLVSSADDAAIGKLIELTERYCVVLRTLADDVRVASQHECRPPEA